MYVFHHHWWTIHVRVERNEWLRLPPINPPKFPTADSARSDRIVKDSSVSSTRKKTARWHSIMCRLTTTKESRYSSGWNLWVISLSAVNSQKFGHVKAFNFDPTHCRIWKSSSFKFQISARLSICLKYIHRYLCKIFNCTDFQQEILKICEFTDFSFVIKCVMDRIKRNF